MPPSIKLWRLALLSRCRSLRTPLGNRQKTIGGLMPLENNGVRTLETIETERLLLRKPRQSDAQAVFHRYAFDREVTRYLSWPTHRSVADTLAFLSMSDDEWRRWPAGPYLVLARQNGTKVTLVGSTGLFYKGPTRAVTGYVFA